MATYTITDNIRRDGYSSQDYKYRYSSSNGRPVAQVEFDRRCAAGLPTFLWRWEDFVPTLIARCNADA